MGEPSITRAASIITENLRNFIEARKRIASDDIHAICTTYGRLANINDVKNVEAGQTFVQIKTRYSEYAQTKGMHGLLFQVEALSDAWVRSTYYELNTRSSSSGELDTERRDVFSTVGEPLMVARRKPIPYTIFPVYASRYYFESKWSYLLGKRQLYILNSAKIDSMELRACLTECSKQTRFRRYGLTIYNCNHVLYSILMHLIKKRRLIKTCNLSPMPPT